MTAERKQPDPTMTYVVVNFEGERPEVLGEYVRTEEDAVFYQVREGGVTWAPYDCVRTMTQRDFDAFHAPAGAAGDQRSLGCRQRLPAE